MERQKVRQQERKRQRVSEKIKWDLGESSTATQPLPEQMAEDKHIWAASKPGQFESPLFQPSQIFRVLTPQAGYLKFPL